MCVKGARQLTRPLICLYGRGGAASSYSGQIILAKGKSLHIRPVVAAHEGSHHDYAGYGEDGADGGRESDAPAGLDGEASAVSADGVAEIEGYLYHGSAHQLVAGTEAYE